MEKKNIENGKDADVSLELLSNYRKSTKVYRDTTSQIIYDTPSFWLSKRLLVATVLFICFINFQLLRNNMNITVVEMKSNKSYVDINNDTIVRPPDFNWDQPTVGLVISIFAYGGLFSVFADLAINRIGGSVTCAWSMLLAGILTMLHPAILSMHFYLFLACRFLTGILEMLFYVGTTDIFARWFPKKEMSALISFSFNGTNIGLTAVYPFCAFLTEKWGWKIVFYITGFMSVVSAILSLILVKNQPSQDKWISKKERDYIIAETDHSAKMNIRHPYRKILISAPVWALCVSVFVYMWFTSLISACLPLFISNLTHKKIEEIGNISSIPNIVYIFFFPIDGAVMDYWKNHSDITITRIHKIITGVAFLFGSLMLLAVAVAFSSDLIASLILFVLIQIPLSFVPIILQVLIVNLAADHSAVLGGLLSSFYSLSAIACQTITGFMTQKESLQEWNNCFYLAAAISAFGAVIFILYGSSETQPWALTSPAKRERQLSETD